MTDNIDISDEMLTAFLDNELSEKETELVSRKLEGDPELADRLAGLELPIGLLQEGANAMLKHAPNPPNVTIAPQNNQRRWLGGVAAAAVLGILIGSLVKVPERQDWVHAVANYQSLYVTDTLADSEPADERHETLASLSQAIDLDITSLMNIDKIAYRRAQMLGFDGQPLVQVAYLDNDIPIAICITLREGQNSPVREDVHFGLASASWQKNGHGFLVIGGNDAALIRQITQQVQDQL